MQDVSTGGKIDSTCSYCHRLGLLNRLPITPVFDLASLDGGRCMSVCRPHLYFDTDFTNPLLQIAMPNLKPPVTTTDEALDYRQVSTHAIALAVCTRAPPVLVIVD